MDSVTFHYSRLKFQVCFFFNSKFKLCFNSKWSKFVFMFSYKKSLKKPKGGNQNPYIEEEQTTQCPNEKGQNDKQQSTNIYCCSLIYMGRLVFYSHVESTCMTASFH